MTVGALPRTARLKALSWPWSYTGATTGGRDLRLDLLRGYSLFAMTIDHVPGALGTESTGGFESWLYRVSVSPAIGFISAAELFVFISGLVMGLLYARFIAQDGLGAATRRILARAAKLYGVIVGLAVFYLLLGNLTTLFPEFYVEDPLDYLVGALTLHMDASGLLVMYVLFIALAPLAFLAILEGKTWLVLALSGLIWAGNLLYPHYFTMPYQLSSGFETAAWQLLFFTGLVIGWHRPRLVALTTGRWRTGYRAYLALLAALALLLLAFNRVYATGEFAAAVSGPAGPWLQELMDSGRLNVFYENLHLAPARLLAVGVFMQLLFGLVTYLYKPLHAALGWLLLPLGQASLYVFTMHLLIVYLLLPRVPGLATLPEPFYGLALVGVVLVLWAMVKARFLFFLIPR